MSIKMMNMSKAAVELWEKRSAALAAGSELMSDKPDVDTWTKQERRLWLYALAIGRRLERLQ